jgi:NAD(P)H-dependent flavin oxidoreductase YrpB (nitropropane dioxygenase family)
MMIHTSICTLLDITHPIVLGGMGTGTSVPLVVAVSQAGGFGTLGAANLTAAQVRQQVAAIRTATDKPFGLNFLLFRVDEESFSAAIQARPSVIAFAWARPDQDLRPYMQRVHDAGLKAMYMAGEVPEAVRAAEAGADVIVAQGTEGGGHVGWMATMTVVPMIVSAVAPRPVLAAGGIADGRGLAAALALGAEGVLLGTRFLATDEAPIHANFKQAIVRSTGHDTMLTEIPDIAARQVWPGAMARVLRNRFIERWAGREWALRQHAREANQALMAARRDGDAEEAALLVRQDAGLIDAILPAAEVIRRMVAEAHEILTGRLPQLCQLATVSRVAQ